MLEIKECIFNLIWIKNQPKMAKIHQIKEIKSRNLFRCRKIKKIEKYEKNQNEQRIFMKHESKWYITYMLNIYN